MFYESHDEFDEAQKFRRSHCAQQEQNHECVGEVRVTRSAVCLDCKLCGKGAIGPPEHPGRVTDGLCPHCGSYCYRHDDYLVCEGCGLKVYKLATASEKM